MPSKKQVKKAASTSKSTSSIAKSSSNTKRTGQKRKVDDDAQLAEEDSPAAEQPPAAAQPSKKVKKTNSNTPSAGMQAKIAQESALADMAVSFLRGILSGGAAAAASNSPSPPAPAAAAAASAEAIQATLQEALNLSKGDRIFEVGREVGPMGSAGCTALASLLTTPANEALAKKVTNFVMTDHKFGDEGAATLATVLTKFPNLDLINLSFNDITAEGLKPLAAALSQLTKLKRICLNYNPFGSAGVRILCEAWLETPRPNKIETLMLGGCGLAPVTDPEKLKADLRDWFPKLQELDYYAPKQR